MSGPKTGTIYLSRAAQRRIEKMQEQIRQGARLDSIKRETEGLNKAIALANRKLEEIELDGSALIDKVTRNAEYMAVMEDSILQFREIKRRHKNSLLAAAKIEIPAEPGEIAGCTKTLEQKIKNAAACYAKESEPLMDGIRNYLEKMTRKDDSGFTSADTLSSRVRDPAFRRMVTEIVQTNAAPDIKHRAGKAIADIQGLIDNDSIQEDDIVMLITIADRLCLSVSENRSSVEAALERFQTAGAQAEKNIAVFDNLYNEYCARLAIYNSITGSYEQHAVIKDKCQFPSISSLNFEVAKLKKRAKRAGEVNYIREAFDEVMREAGYVTTGIGNIFSEEQIKEHKADNFTWKNSRGNSIWQVNVTQSNEIMMQVMGAGETKRRKAGRGGNPVVNSEISTLSGMSNEEKEFLLNEQHAFCKLYPGIIEKLKEKYGVIVSITDDKKPDYSYCRKLHRVEYDEPDAESPEYTQHTPHTRHIPDTQKAYSRKSGDGRHVEVSKPLRRAVRIGEI